MTVRGLPPAPFRPDVAPRVRSITFAVTWLGGLPTWVAILLLGMPRQPD